VSKHKVVSPRASASTPGSTKDGSVVGHFTTSSGQGQTTRGGLRVYKVVVLGDGGVGKSGVYKLSYGFITYTESITIKVIHRYVEFVVYGSIEIQAKCI
jgi:hypothetical protein